MNVLIISYEYPPIGGGVGTSMLYYAKALEGCGHNIDVLVPTDTTIYDEMRISNNVTIIPTMICKKKRFKWTVLEMLSWGWNVWAECDLENIVTRILKVKSKKYDLIHYWGGFPAVCVPLHSKKHTPKIITFHGSDVPGRNKKFDWVYKLPLGYKKSCKNVIKLTAVSRGLSDLATKWIGREVEFIPNGINHHETQSNVRSNRLVTMSRLTKLKRVDILISAMKHLPNDYTLDIYGDGPEREYLESIADKRVNFHGWVDGSDFRLPDYKIYVNAADDIGVSNISELEALGYGLPVVRLSGKGIESFNGAIIASNLTDPYCLAEKIKSVSKNYDYYRQKVNDIIKENSWKIIGKRYVDIYEESI